MPPHGDPVMLEVADRVVELLDGHLVAHAPEGSAAPVPEA